MIMIDVHLFSSNKVLHLLYCIYHLWCTTFTHAIYQNTIISLYIFGDEKENLKGKEVGTMEGKRENDEESGRRRERMERKGCGGKEGQGEVPDSQRRQLPSRRGQR
jgi:hypothetical protein